MNKFIDTKYFKIALYAIFVIVVTILTYHIASDADNFLPRIYNTYIRFVSIFTPIIYGLLIAYLINPIMCFFEAFISEKLKPQSPLQFKRIRIISIILVYASLFSTVFFTIRFMIPEIFNNLVSIVNNHDHYISIYTKVSSQVTSFIATNLPYPEIQVAIATIFDPSSFTNLFSVDMITQVINTVISSTVSLTSGLFNWVIGFVIAIYTLMQKETFSNGIKRLTYALLKEDTANKIIGFFTESHSTITKFFVGKSLDSLIIGVLAFIVLSFMQNPYALLLALIIGLSNMIPYFGPFIGAVPAVLLTLFEGLSPAIAVAIFILILQQFDGLYLGPKILGDSIGLTPFWIIAAITIGGALGGLLGMFFASPILAVILSTTNKWIDLKLHNKAIHLPKLAYSDVIPNTDVTLKASNKN